jgi:alpha,alpha-trehalase
MWDENAGLYFDYNFQIRKVRRYPFLTTFYPLWAGIATPHQAERVMHNLMQFERPGGLQTSTFRSGNQWDAPFGWAPLEMIGVEGMRRYGYNDAANRVTAEFLSLVLKDFLANGRIVEKYDVVRRATDVSSSIGYGYRSNEAGFGWTNAAFLQLYSEMPDSAKSNVLRLGWEPPKGAAAVP